MCYAVARPSQCPMPGTSSPPRTGSGVSCCAGIHRTPDSLAHKVGYRWSLPSLCSLHCKAPSSLRRPELACSRPTPSTTHQHTAVQSREEECPRCRGTSRIKCQSCTDGRLRRGGYHERNSINTSRLVGVQSERLLRHSHACSWAPGKHVPNYLQSTLQLH